jgi:fructokinase
MRIGIDLGGSKIEIIALDHQGTVLCRRRIGTPADYEAILDTLCRLIHEVETELGLRGSVGIGIPGTLSPDHGRIKNANSTCLIGHTLDPDLAQRLRRPVRIANDADCLTLSEARDGAAAGASSVLGVILGTGVGGGVVINGQLLAGPNAIAGEWGHNPLPWAGAADIPARLCYCGKAGCIETYLSGPGFAAHYRAAGGDDLSAIEIVQRMKVQEPLACERFNHYCDQLARSLASVINILDPEVVVLGGGLSNIDRLCDEVIQRWGAYVFSDRVNTRLVKARHGDSSGVRGAAWLWPA